MGVVYDVAGYLAVNAGMVRSLLTHLEEVGVTAEAAHCSELLVVLAKHSPQVQRLDFVASAVHIRLVFNFPCYFAPQAFQGSVSEVSAWLRACVGTDGASKPKHREARAQLFSQCLAMLSSTAAVFETDAQLPTFCSSLVAHIKQSEKADICARLSEVIILRISIFTD